MTESDITSIVNCTLAETPKEVSVFSATATSILCPVISLGNFLVILSVIRNPNKDLRTPFNFFAVNLAIADLVVGLLTCPLAVGTHIVEARGTVPNDMKTLRQSLHFSYFVSVSASLLNLAALCIDRVIAIRFPLIYRVELSFWHHFLSAIGIWLVAVTVPIVYFRTGYEQMTMIMAAVSILFTFLVMIFTIFILYMSVRNRASNASRDEGRFEANAGLALENMNNRPRNENEETLNNGIASGNSMCAEQKYVRQRSQSIVLAAITRDEADERETWCGRKHRKIQAIRSLGAKPSAESIRFFERWKLCLESCSDIADRTLRKDDHILVKIPNVYKVNGDSPPNDSSSYVGIELDSKNLCNTKKLEIINNNEEPNVREKIDTASLQNERVSTSELIDKNKELTLTASKSESSCAEDCTNVLHNSHEIGNERKNNEEAYDSPPYNNQSTTFDEAKICDTPCSLQRSCSMSSFRGDPDNASCNHIENGRNRARCKSESSSQLLKLHASYRKLEKTLLTMISAFLVCFVPSSAMIIYLNTSGGNCKLRHWMRDLSFHLAIANSAVNPFIYAWRLPPFRKAIKSILCSKKKNQVQPRSLGRATLF